MRRRFELMQLEMGMSTSRYLPASGTAGLARSLVSGNSRVPAPPPMITDSTRLVSTLTFVPIAAMASLPETCPRCAAVPHSAFAYTPRAARGRNIVPRRRTPGPASRSRASTFDTCVRTTEKLERGEEPLRPPDAGFGVLERSALRLRGRALPATAATAPALTAAAALTARRRGRYRTRLAGLTPREEPRELPGRRGLEDLPGLRVPVVEEARRPGHDDLEVHRLPRALLRELAEVAL